MEAQVGSWDEHQADQAVAVLKAVADPSRYRLLWALTDRELPVSRLAEIIGAHVAATSQHLARLRGAGLVDSRREGTRIFYRAAGPRVRALLEGAVLAADEAGAQEEAAGEVTGTAPETARAGEKARAARPATAH
ncbi:metalloregulator ArsR/SmtB family transcription factor [Streptomyces niveiscabiei]|uniref:ArsR/SmtB family transcription factor n=1 Tax=Streptomyces niveiscabiei TaxID=164115 RepID=UPI0029BF2C08|nr:metalloregulator ArsR/SmtB family transcription factor [Streptomyces niveiscabiei]MDX3380633.1 metalloregulator ArsR/SmtB family transcription factor [Streptomyces niveiscabiei]